MEEIETIGFQIGPDNQQQSTPPSVPASFTRYKPNGNLELRLVVDHNNMMIECGLHSSWGLVWKNEGNYDVRNLLNLECEHIPPAIVNYGCAWHLHQAWFKNRETPIPGRTLERMHVSASERINSWMVKFENLNRYDVLDSNILLRMALSGNNSQTENIFEFLHDMNKKILRKFLTDQISQRIELNVQ